MNPLNEVLAILKEKYAMLLKKEDLAEVMNCSLSSIDNLLRTGGNLPKPIKFADTRNASIRFLNTEVAEFLVNASKGV
ncbi:hypothetical protein GJV85_03480 [Sulfurimonas aquatica]|uniref:Uncharacterized protein n=1 Tax=Sulfurimonas aquatica TaxID=2672570 RepID=A0A975GBZ8_9BACT|nr:hypothetical protein [Sulfurimonas aquatica]QSZ41211.1 hypothetical protein GJV85_03480 [Sulfurimonas aquatica]